LKRVKIFVKGIVQGVGFRPFVYRLAKKYNAKGWVQNRGEGVEIDVELEDERAFLSSLKKNSPPLCKIEDVSIEVLPPENFKDFKILESEEGYKKTFVSPDISICDNCLKELFDENNRRFLYPLINCTDCGPRYTIIKTLPYDRKNTSMSKFQMCKICEEEYFNPLDRRYHAQPISCFNCGPKTFLEYENKRVEESKEIFKQAAFLIKRGKILAIKGLGGFHLICDATNLKAVKKLRERKKRPLKPFAVMFKDISQIKEVCSLSKEEEALISSKERPIVLVKKRKFHRLERRRFKISSLVALNVDYLGVFLPYTPIHYLLFSHLDIPIVATSANLSQEPIIRSKEELERKLGGVYDAILGNEREILNACDDSVAQIVDGKKVFIRLSRGYAPFSVNLPFRIKRKVLAVGAMQKDTISLAFDRNFILSPHIGDLDSIDAFEYFKRTVETFKRFYDFNPEVVVFDKHPKYDTSKWAKELEIKKISVYHHLSHIYCALFEAEVLEKMEIKDYLGFSWDGTGYGEDKNIWGGEIFLNDNRVSHFRYFKLLGGEMAVREPRRVAISLLFEVFGKDALSLPLESVKAFNDSQKSILYKSWERDIGSFYTSSVGRIFDAVASLTGVVQILDYEGQSGLYMEKYYDEEIKDLYSFNVKDSIDFFPMIEEIVKDVLRKRSKREIVSKFINTLSEIILHFAKENKESICIFSGGVFQNRVLLLSTVKKLEKENLRYFFPSRIPINDGGISAGQLWYAIKKNFV